MSRVSSRIILKELNRYCGIGFYRRILQFCHAHLIHSSSVSSSKKAAFLFVILLCSEISISLLSPVTRSIRLIPPNIPIQNLSEINSNKSSRNFNPVTFLKNYLISNTASLISLYNPKKVMPELILIKKIILTENNKLVSYKIADIYKISNLLPKMFAWMLRGPPADGVAYLNIVSLCNQTIQVNSLYYNSLQRCFHSFKAKIHVFFSILSGIILFAAILKLALKNVILNLTIAQCDNLTFLEKGKPSERAGRKAIWPTVTKVTMVAGLPKGRILVYIP